MAQTSRKRDKKITILYPTYETDEVGCQTQNLVPLPGGENIWAYYRQASGNEFFSAHRANIKVEVIFEIAWRDDLENHFQIRYKGQDYNITRIDDFEGYKKTLRISAYKIN